MIVSIVRFCCRKPISLFTSCSFSSVYHHHHHLVLFSLREMGPCVLSLQVSRFLAQLLASVHPLNPSSPLSFSTVLLHVSLGLPLLRFPSGVQVRAILGFSFAFILSICPIIFQRLLLGLFFPRCTLS